MCRGDRRCHQRLNCSFSRKLCDLFSWKWASAISILHFSVVDDRSAVTGTMIYMALIIAPARVQAEGEVMQHFLSQSIFVCPPKLNWLIDRRECWKVGVCRAAVAGAVLTFHHSYIRLWDTHSTVICPGSLHWNKCTHRCFLPPEHVSTLRQHL